MTQPMQTVEETADLQAPATTLYAVVTDYERYPHWLPEFKSARVVARNGDTVDVEFQFAIPLKKITYVLRIVHQPPQLQTDWTFVHGDLIDDMVGGWKFTALNDQRTRVHYYAGVSIHAPVSKGLVNRIATLLTGTTLPRTFQNLEREARARL